MRPPPPAPKEKEEGSRAGYVTLVGRPNAGKSTLLNALLQEPLSIVTAKAQTTWQRVTGILTTGRSQIIFLDTPGLLDPRDLLQRSMLLEAQLALSEADEIVLVLDAAAPASETQWTWTVEALSERPSVPLLVALNKTDIARNAAIEELEERVNSDLGGETFRISALKEDGLSRLLRRIEELLPPGPFLFPPDEIAAAPVRFFVAEMVRQTVYEQYRQEIPYSVFCRVEEFREAEDPVYIQAHLFVERKSQKGILLGKGGSSIKRLGSEARKRVEEFLGRRIYLDLWVKVLPDWRRKRAHLKTLGFTLPSGDPEP